MSLNSLASKTHTREQAIILFGIMIVAAFLRLWNLGELGIRDDEDITKLAIQGVLGHGYPLMPSGMIYLRSSWFLFVQSGFGWLFEPTDGWLRLPAVLASLGTIPVAYLFAARLFSKRVGIGVAVLLAVSYSEIELARMTRMYAPFALIYLLTVMAIYRRYVDGSSGSAVLPLALALVANVTHQLGFTLAILFFIPLVIVPNMNRLDRFRAAGSGVCVGAGFLLWRKIFSLFFERSSRLYGTPVAELDAESGTGSGIIGWVVSLLTELDVPQPVYLYSLVMDGSAATLVIGTALAIAVGMIIYLGQRQQPKVLVAVATLLFAACLLHQINVSILLLLVYFYAAKRGIEPLRRATGLTLIVAIGISLSSWLTYAYLFAEPNEVAAAGISTHFRQSLRFLLDFPQYNVVWGFPFERPLASVPAVIGMLWCIDGAARRQASREKLFLLLVFLVPLVVTGLFETTYRMFRYILHFDAFFLLFVVLGVLKWREVLSALGWPSGALGRQAVTTVITILLAFVSIGYSLNPLKSWLSVERDYGEPDGLAAFFKVPFYPDFRTTAAYIAANRGGNDALVVMQSREYYSYLGEGSYWLTVNSDEHRYQTYIDADGQRRDAYVDTPVLSSSDELFSVIRSSVGSTWLVAPDQLVASRQTLTDDLVRYIEGLSNYLVFTGRDGDMRVYEIPRDSVL